MSQIVLNTLALVQDMKAKQKTQQDYFSKLSPIGITVAEVRREMFEDPAKSAPLVLSAAKQAGLDLYYSVPEMIYKNNVLNTAVLQAVAAEAVAMGATRVKMVVGEWEGIVSSKDSSFLQEHFADKGLRLSIENDQTPLNGHPQKMAQFINTCYAAGYENIDITFDVGNWIYTGENPLKAATLLAPYVGFIHLKDVSGAVPPTTHLLNEGIVDWKVALDILPKNVPLAIEYPCGEEAIPVITKEVQKILSAINS